MLKKLFLTSFLTFTCISLIYPSKKENTNLFQYCYSLEKIITRNFIEPKENFPKNFKSLSKDITQFGVDKTKGSLVNLIIDQYKKLKKSSVISFFPNKFYCFAGYWTERVNPGTFESIFYYKNERFINKYKSLKNDADVFINNFNSEYEIIKKKFNRFF